MTNERRDPPHPPAISQLALEETRAWLLDWMSKRLRLPISEIRMSRSFADHGLDSVMALELAEALSRKLGIQLDETLLWEAPTIDALLAAVTQKIRASSAGTAANMEPSGKRSANGSDSSSGTLDDEILLLEQELALHHQK